MSSAIRKAKNYVTVIKRCFIFAFTKPKSVSGIYIHIPFCRSKCSYCDFYSVANTKLIEKYILSLLKEIKLKKDIFANKSISTIYFGGGTPSIMPVATIENILEEIYKNYDISNLKELSLEANPEDLNYLYLKDIRSLSVNRISIGIQSIYDNILKFMRRKHDSKTSVDAVLNAHKAGFENICIDLIYGVPGLSSQMWRNTLNKSINLPVKHLSAYHLGIEPGTILHKHLNQCKFEPVSDEVGWEQFVTLTQMCSEKGLEHYEISNFAIPGFKSIHNSSYWGDSEYLGFGASAHSYFSNLRTRNISNIQKYIDDINSGTLFTEKEVIDKTKRYNEYLIKRLRTIKGINLDEFSTFFGESALVRLNKKIKELNKKHYKSNNKFFSLSLEGLFISDNIIEHLME